MTNLDPFQAEIFNFMRKSNKNDRKQLPEKQPAACKDNAFIFPTNVVQNSTSFRHFFHFISAKACTTEIRYPVIIIRVQRKQTTARSKVKLV